MILSARGTVYHNHGLGASTDTGTRKHVRTHIVGVWHVHADVKRDIISAEQM